MLPSRNPPAEGEITRVTLSMDEEMPSIPPISAGVTALLMALLSTVFSIPPPRASGSITTSRTGRFGVTAHPTSPKTISHKAHDFQFAAAQEDRGVRWLGSPAEVVTLSLFLLDDLEQMGAVLRSDSGGHGIAKHRGQ